jgi:hypothetical protein
MSFLILQAVRIQVQPVGQPVSSSMRIIVSAMQRTNGDALPHRATAFLISYDTRCR